ncbi:hypothetical protein [Cupriavidus necator]|uniref:hypothetical protein n=1 Tax=Cupriavidus necator TaxID=106590 RepID=UPI000F4DFE2F|nr:hypothetical protein [Cupriavidus necator]
MSRTKYLVGAALLLASIQAGAGIFTSDGSTYEECLENRRGEIKNPNQHAIASQYCRQKHPEPVLDLGQFSQNPAPDPVALYLISGTDPKLSGARQVVSLLNIARIDMEHDGHSYGYGIKSPDFKWYASFSVTNRNSFPVSSVIIGIPKKGVRGCSWNESDYAEFYDCRGAASGKMTGKFKCYIPNVEKRNLSYCLTGLAIEGTNADVNNYLKAAQ